MSGYNKRLQIGVLLGNSQTEHPREVITGIYDVLAEEDVQITFFLGAQGRALEFWDEDADHSKLSYVYQYNTLYDYALLGSMDALVIAYGTLSTYLNEVEQLSFLPKFRSIPLVVLERYEKNCSYSYVLSDNYTSMRKVVEHLVVFHGYKKVLHLSGPHGNYESLMRQKAYTDVLTENGIEVTDSMIAEGDYSVFVEEIIEKLLDDNPGAEALVCANDEMAMAAYNVCQKRGIVVGRDLAITGYDDIDSAQTLDPPLTTANQDGVEIGYKSIKAAIKLCQDTNSSMHQELIKSPLIVRGSCGCDYLGKTTDERVNDNYSQIRSASDDQLISQTAQIALDSILKKKNVPDHISDSFTNICKGLIKILLSIRNEDYNREHLDYINKSILVNLRDFFSVGYDEIIQYINLAKMLDNIRMFINCEINRSLSPDALMMLNSMNSVISHHMEALIMQQSSIKTEALLQQNWSIPYGLQHLTERSSNNAELFGSTLQILKDIGIKNAFLLLNQIPISVKRNTPVTRPASMHVVARMIDGEVESWNFDEARQIDKRHGFTDLYPKSDSKTPYSVFLLFQEESQFGLLICETEPNMIDSLFGVALQISTALAFRHLRAEEERSKVKLYDTLRTLEEKNKVLSFVSSTDPLTNLSNRRGFMEQIFDMKHNHEGERGYLFFFDLDHLKEINDVYGHAEGDFAIINSASFIKQLFERDGFCARLGGDEFVGVITYDRDNPGVADDLLEDLRDITDNFNLTSQKPYYVEFSSGYTSFVFNEALDVDAVLKGADNALYEAKRNRRPTIKKE